MFGISGAVYWLVKENELDMVGVIVSPLCVSASSLFRQTRSVDGCAVDDDPENPHFDLGLALTGVDDVCPLNGAGFCHDFCFGALSAGSPCAARRVPHTP